MERTNPAPSRPLSPHLQAYRLPLTALLSITHRITGVVLSLGLVGLVLALFAIAQGPAAYGAVHASLSSPWGGVVLWAWIAALIFHLVHGVRHLFWDTGRGYSLTSLNRYALGELAAALVLFSAVALSATLLS
ncbi:MAG: succinate dehydrogenase, cytochrome b556 subunit [Methylococcus sp.]|nr:succinate dehydrogenase, cytochrome b556 subunit [Methylococcus sp.]